MQVAIEGCAHGDLDKIYAALKRLEETEQIRVDLLIICGDFQAIRNGADLDCMAVPPKYKEIGTFHKYYSGEVEAPFPTLFSKSSEIRPPGRPDTPPKLLTKLLNAQLEEITKRPITFGSSIMEVGWRQRSSTLGTRV